MEAILASERRKMWRVLIEFSPSLLPKDPFVFRSKSRSLAWFLKALCEQSLPLPPVSWVAGPFLTVPSGSHSKIPGDMLKIHIPRPHPQGFCCFHFRV